MCKAYANLPPSGPNAPLRAEREVRYKAHSPKIYQRKPQSDKTIN